MATVAGCPRLNPTMGTGALASCFADCTQGAIPLGLDAVFDSLLKLYPTQRNPLQASAKTKCWLGGPDPLDYVSIYNNPGDRQDIPGHWHYIGMGLSDLFGDGRLHPHPQFPREGEPPPTSGFGFELTFRLKQEKDETEAPKWPCGLLQKLGKMVWGLAGEFSDGETVYWHYPLDGRTQSPVQHLLFALDPQLPPILSPFGQVQFIQVVGIFEEEFQAANCWNGSGVAGLLESSPLTGGRLLITDLGRRQDLFQLLPNARARVDKSIREEGSSRDGVTCGNDSCGWKEWMSVPNRYGSTPNDVGGLVRLNAVELQLSKKLLPNLSVLLNGRLPHGRLFTFDIAQDQTQIIIGPPGGEGLKATRDDPFIFEGKVLYVLLSETLQRLLLEELVKLNPEEILGTPKSIQWPSFGLKVTILP